MTDFRRPGTALPAYTVSRLAAEIKAYLGEAFWDVEVVGEVHRLRRSRSGHVYLELVEKGRGDEILARLDAVVFRSDLFRIEGLLRRAGQGLSEGLRIRAAGRVDLYPPSGKLQLVLQDVDPTFGLGDLERRRRENLRALEEAGLLDRNGGLPLADVPLAIGLVTSAGSAAYHDFVSGLRASGFGFRVTFVHAAVQGREAEREVASALALLSARRLDAVALVRGGGARADLQAFDSRVICEAVARCAVPVLTGLGHEIDRSLVDRVAHTALKTPTQVAEHLAGRVSRSDQRLRELEAALARTADRRLERARVRVEKGRQIARLAMLRLGAAEGRVGELQRALERAARRGLGDAGRRLDRLRRSLATAPGRPLARAAGRPEELARRLAAIARAKLETAGARVEGLGRAAAGAAPERILERGFSLTLDAAGRPVRSTTDVAIGDTITTRLADGTLTSRVEAR